MRKNDNLLKGIHTEIMNAIQEKKDADILIKRYQRVVNNSHGIEKDNNKTLLDAEIDRWHEQQVKLDLLHKLVSDYKEA